MAESVAVRQVKKYRDKTYRDRFISRWSKADEECDLRPGSFLAYVVDMYSDPSDVRLRVIRNGRDGFACDRARMKGYFAKALRELEVGNGKK